MSDAVETHFIIEAGTRGRPALWEATVRPVERSVISTAVFGALMAAEAVNSSSAS